uniref:Uncharacterized protein n=1 Tax=Rhinolophus ferrumequinum TaxID=59479 RepID=A0A671DL49_RHIFE
MNPKLNKRGGFVFITFKEEEPGENMDGPGGHYVLKKKSPNCHQGNRRSGGDGEVEEIRLRVGSRATSTTGTRTVAISRAPGGHKDLPCDYDSYGLALTSQGSRNDSKSQQRGDHHNNYMPY